MNRESLRQPVDGCGGAGSSAKRRTLQGRMYCSISCLVRHVSRKVFRFSIHVNTCFYFTLGLHTGPVVILDMRWLARLQHSPGEASGARTLRARGTPAADRPWSCHHSPFPISPTSLVPSRPGSVSASTLGSTSTAVCCCASSTSNSSPGVN